MALSFNNGSVAQSMQNLQNGENKSNGNFSGGSSSSIVLDLLNGENKENTGSSGSSSGSSSMREQIKNSTSGPSASFSDSGSSSGPSQSFKVNNGAMSASTTYVGADNKPVKVEDVFSTNAPSIMRTGAVNSGDYQASKNEKSDVKTSTFSKGSDVVTNPALIVQNKGLVDNQAIDSIEGLLKRQKDKASQEVLDSSKKRNKAEEKDKSDKLKDQLKNSFDDEEEGTDFQLGKRIAAKEEDAMNEAEKKYNDALSKVPDMTVQEALDNWENASDELDKAYALLNEAENSGDETAITKCQQAYAIAKLKADGAKNTLSQVNEAIELKTQYEDAKKAYEAAFTNGSNFNELNNNVAAAVENGSLSEADAKTITEKTRNIDVAQNKLDKAVSAIAGKDISELTDDEINTYIEAQNEYNKNLNDALNASFGLAQTDFNKEFTTAIAQANDFDVTLPDGSTVSYSKVATDMVTKSPQIAAAMYESKASRLEGDGHKILAKVERMKANMVQTWAGSKVTFNDNKVRDQFNQMADTNMRATYAAYNNVLNDPNASDEQKAEASEQISQAQALKTASTALKASTGFLSGIGDSMSDGEYGTTNPEELSTTQDILAKTKAFSQIVLGLGITPAANKAYQNLYYMNKDYETKDTILSKDFDKDGFAWVEEYGNNAAAGMVLAGGELATGIALCFSPSTMANGINLIADSIQNSFGALYGVRGNAEKAAAMTSEITSWFQEAVTEVNGLPEEATGVIEEAITQIEDFELKADEVGDIDNWLEGSGSNTASNEKFNQALSYDEWLKLIESDETLRNYAKELVKKEKEEEEA